MKILILLATMLISVCSYAVEPVQGAVYTEIRGVSGGRIRVYKGACFSHKAARNIFSKVWNPTLCFFDAKGHKLAQEEFADWRLLDESAAGFNWPNYEKAIQNVRSRLTHKPKAHDVIVVQGKGPAQQYIKLFDKQGMLIATTYLEYWWLKKGDLLPEKAVKALSDYVRNPAILSSLKVIEVWSLMLLHVASRNSFFRK